MTIIFSGGVNEISRKWKSVDTRLTRKGFFRGMKKPNCLIFSWVMFDFGVAHSGIINIIFVQHKINTIQYISVDYENSD